MSANGHRSGRVFTAETETKRDSEQRNYRALSQSDQKQNRSNVMEQGKTASDRNVDELRLKQEQPIVARYL